MSRAQALIMLVLTLAMGALVIFRAPRPQEARIAELETQVAGAQATILFLRAQPTPLPSPSPDIRANLALASTATAALTAPTSVLLIGTTFPTAPPAGASGPRADKVEASTQVDPRTGCAVNPASVFTSSDTIYGVATLAEMRAGDTIVVQFSQEGTGAIIYEETFTIQEGGSYCRWYVIRPDAAGWEAGTYRISYTVNANLPIVATYSITANAPVATEDSMGAGG